MTLEHFLYEEKGPVGILTVNRPKALNALNSALLREFVKVLQDLKTKPQLRALILTGSGDKAFIAGADISEMATMSKSQALQFAKLGQHATLLLEELPFPVIGAVNGFALGGGCEMAIACDFILCSENAVFGQPEVCLGLIPGFGGSARLYDFVGWPMARELIYTGKKIKADEAMRLGLVNRVMPLDKLMDEAMRVADEISRNSPVAIRAAKHAMRKVRSEARVEARLEIEARDFSLVFESQDQKEGTKAFIEKRKPAFKGN